MAPFQRLQGKSDAMTRRADRLPVNFKVEVTDDSGETRVFATRNISDTGVFLVTDGARMPPVGSLVRVRLQGNLGCGEEPPTLTMRIVRLETLGVALRFMDEDMRRKGAPDQEDP